MCIKCGLVSAKGKLGSLDFQATRDVEITQVDGKVWVKPANDSNKARAMWGTARARIQNMVTGVSEGFKKELEINGVGYRAAVQGSALNLQLGFSHDVAYPIPEGIPLKCEKPTSLPITGADRHQVGQVAADDRSSGPPQPHQG